MSTVSANCIRPTITDGNCLLHYGLPYRSAAIRDTASIDYPENNLYIAPSNLPGV